VPRGPSDLRSDDGRSVESSRLPRGWLYGNAVARRLAALSRPCWRRNADLLRPGQRNNSQTRRVLRRFPQTTLARPRPSRDKRQQNHTRRGNTPHPKPWEAHGSGITTQVLIRIEKKELNAHRKVQDWRRRNQQGYVLNLKSPKQAILHCTICFHLGDTEWEEGRTNWGSMGNSTKLCSTVKEELTLWAETNLKAPLKVCRSCSP
jgi:hypothetical protein